MKKDLQMKYASNYSFVLKVVAMITAAAGRQVAELPAGNFLRLGVSRDQKEIALQLLP